ncbi:unnamed protein product [Triticum turgidum subsp. durum]|uniref:Uncharacterized protein n=1 Tax=Triticum turgidum subsp. durum TaxID=4567 RepID=A0A9R1BIH5_TRITD|nr:unnamed protein product [Triticum turgidum subsp. durum]
MGLLDQLWDETVAGPRPDHGFSKLRKYSSFSPSSPAAADVAPAVTRSITIARPPSLSLPSGESSSVPSTPASAPDSPFAAGRLEGVPPEIQDGQRRRRPGRGDRRAQEPNRVRLGGDQFIGPIIKKHNRSVK